MAKISLMEVMAIVWECETCQIQFDTQAPIYEEIKGEFVYFSCPSCSHDYRIELEETARK
jgi:hypothetical protein